MKMNKKDIKPSALHEIPKEIEKVLLSNTELLMKWNSLTPLARNEWICWTIIPKKEETRKEHLVRLQEDLLKGEKRPCCWPGCPHRRESAKKWFKQKHITSFLHIGHRTKITGPESIRRINMSPLTISRLNSIGRIQSFSQVT